MPLELLNQIKARLAAMPKAYTAEIDPQLAAEAMLLLRMVLKDGELQAREIDLLQRVGRSAFALPETDCRAVIMGMRTFVRQAGMGQATAIYRDMDAGRRRMLARKLIDAMQADTELKARQARFRARLMVLLDLKPDDLLKPAA